MIGCTSHRQSKYFVWPVRDKCQRLLRNEAADQDDVLATSKTFANFLNREPLSRNQPNTDSVQISAMASIHTLRAFSRAPISRRLHTATRLLAKGSNTADPSKPIILEQPDAFRPPSHPARIRKKRPRMIYGRDLTPEDKEELNAKHYPYTAPPENSMMGQFMRAKYLHMYISLVCTFREQKQDIAN